MAVKQRVSVRRVRPKHRQHQRTTPSGSLRNIFATGVAFSVVGAGVLGSTLAWRSDQVSGQSSVNVGALDWEFAYEQVEGAFLGPNGRATVIGHLAVSNFGDFNLGLPDALNGDDGFGEVIINSVDVGHQACDALNFSGAVINLSADDEVAPGETESLAGRVVMEVDENAPEACIGAEVSYQVRLSVVTLDNGAVGP